MSGLITHWLAAGLGFLLGAWMFGTATRDPDDPCRRQS